MINPMTESLDIPKAFERLTKNEHFTPDQASTLVSVFGFKMVDPEEIKTVLKTLDAKLSDAVTKGVSVLKSQLDKSEEHFKELLVAQEKATILRFDAVDQRLESMDKRFDDSQAAMNQRFDSVDKRFDDSQATMNQRFDSVDKRFDDQQKWIEQRFLDQLTMLKGYFWKAGAAGILALLALLKGLQTIGFFTL